MNFSVLPPEIKLQIFSHLDERALRNASHVSSEWNEIAKDRTLHLSEIDPVVVENALSQNYTVTRISHKESLDYTSYLHLVNGEPVISHRNPGEYGSIPIDSKTTITMPPYYGEPTKDITLDSKTYSLGYHLVTPSGDSIYCIKDIGHLYGKLIVIQHYSKGIYLLEPKNRNRLKRIADIDEPLRKIVCDEKKGVIYGLTDQDIFKIDFKHVDPAQKKIRLNKIISYIGRLAIKTIKNLFSGISLTFEVTFKVHALTILCALTGATIGGLVAGLTAASIFTVAAASFILVEITFLSMILLVGTVIGVGTTVYEVITHTL